VGTQRFAIGVEISHVPFTIPGILIHLLLHRLVVGGVLGSYFVLAEEPGQLRHLQQGLAVQVRRKQ